jgi:hypothetical protein
MLVGAAFTFAHAARGLAAVGVIGSRKFTLQTVGVRPCGACAGKVAGGVHVIIGVALRFRLARSTRHRTKCNYRVKLPVKESIVRTDACTVSKPPRCNPVGQQRAKWYEGSILAFVNWGDAGIARSGAKTVKLGRWQFNKGRQAVTSAATLTTFQILANCAAVWKHIVAGGAELARDGAIRRYFE